MRVHSRDKLQELFEFEQLADKPALLELMVESGCVLRGHFSLINGNHTEYFLRFGALQYQSGFVPTIARNLLDDANLDLHGLSPMTAILAPESSGFLLADCIHHLLNAERQLRGMKLVITKVDLQRRPTTELRRGSLEGIEDIIVINDVSTSGSSLQTLMRLADENDATIRAILLMAARSPDRIRDVFPNRPYCSFLIRPRWAIHAPSNCPMCKRGHRDIVPATELN